MQIKNLHINQRKIPYVFIAISFFAHMIGTFLMVADRPMNLLTGLDNDEQEIKIKLVNLDNKRKQIVATEESTIKKADNARFLSKNNNAVERETKSKYVGTFKSAAIGNRDAIANKNIKQTKVRKQKNLKKIKFSDLAFKAKDNFQYKEQPKKQTQTLTKRGLKNGTRNGIALGQTSDFLEDIPLGDFTRLNTQEYEFYGFYHRIREKLEQFWGANIQEKAQKIHKEGRHIASDSNLVTGLTIMLDSRGEIVEILLKSTSGVQELDDAAVEAFNQAGPFPNPPKGMIKNGRATIEWGFVVNT